MDEQRRQFFRRLTGQTTEAAVKQVEARVLEKAKQWIRPPFAIHELEFLFTCTRCGDCARACPHQVIFNLPARLGADVVGTPALDLLNKGCHLCDDTPCVSACTAHALRRDTASTLTQLRLAQVQIDTSRCLPYLGPECGACISTCTIEGALVFHHEKPHIDPQRCTGCARCREACITEPKAVTVVAMRN